MQKKKKNIRLLKMGMRSSLHLIKLRVTFPNYSRERCGSDICIGNKKNAYEQRSENKMEKDAYCSTTTCVTNPFHPRPLLLGEFLVVTRDHNSLRWMWRSHFRPAGQSSQCQRRNLSGIEGKARGKFVCEAQLVRKRKWRAKGLFFFFFA